MATRHHVKMTLFALALLLLTGCAQGIVVLAHPQTGQTVECKADARSDGLGSTQIEKCVKAYKDAGYTIKGDSR